MPHWRQHSGQMSRTRRPYQPGSAYHLTTRTQGHEALFTPAIRTEMLEMLAESVRITDVVLLAHSIMPNHLHLVIQHRFDAMGRLMQRFLCRVARRVQKRHGIQGHVFERAYCHVACLSPEHLRNAIAYTNLNAVRAGLCDLAHEYPWCSASAYLGLSSNADPVSRLLHRPHWLFAHPSCMTNEDEITAYGAFLKWRLERDRLQATGACESDLPPKIQFKKEIGDTWSQEFSIVLERPLEMQSGASEDLRDIARRTLAEEGDPVTLFQVRGSRGPRELVALRWKVMRRMAAAGHPGYRIAEFFGTSKAAVSYALTRSGMRTGHT